MQTAVFIGMGLIVLYAFSALALAAWSASRNTKSNIPPDAALKH